MHVDDVKHDCGILIAGAGPVGLVAAMCLADADIPVTVVERESRVSADLRASTFHPPTLDMLAPSGITGALLARGLVSRTWQVRMHATGEKAEFDLALVADHTDHPYRLQCEQAVLGELLAERLAAHPRGRLLFGAELVDLEQRADGVLAGVRHAGARLEFGARYLLGADGASSTVRSLLGLEMHGSTYPETTALVSTRFAFHEHIEGLSNVNYCWAKDGNFALLRLPELWRCSLYYPPRMAPEEAMSDARVQAQLQAICPHDGRFEIVDKRPYRVHQRIVNDYRVGRVLLAGDAAHLNSPSGGMGMNGGIHDAFNLCGKLAAVWRGADASVLDAYTRERRPVAEQQIIVQSDRNRKRMTDKDPARRRAALAELQAIAADPRRAKAHLLRTSMLEGLHGSGAAS